MEQSAADSALRTAKSEGTLPIGVTQPVQALGQIAILPGVLPREQIKLQVALANALMYVKGDATLDTKAAVERARVHQLGEALAVPLEDPAAAVLDPLRLLVRKLCVV